MVSGLGDLAIVVVRYFGGTKLGTGGLVQAYTQVSQKVLAEIPRAVKGATTTLMFELVYAQLENVHRLVKQSRGEIMEEALQADVCMTARFISGDTLEFETTLRDFGRGRIRPRVVQVKPDSPILISPKAGWMPVSQESDSDKTK